MKDIVKPFIIRIIIGILLIVCAVVFYLIHADEKSKLTQALTVSRELVSVSLLEIKNPPPDMFIKIQDTQSKEIFDNVFVSKACPLYEKNEVGKTMEIEKDTVYYPATDTKENVFKGFYESLCIPVVKKETTPKS